MIPFAPFFRPGVDSGMSKLPPVYSPKILVIAYFYPPDLIGVRRLLANLKVWSELGLEPVVVTCGPKRGAGFDPNPLNDPVFRKIPVFAAGSYDPYRMIEFWRPSIPSASRGSEPAKKTNSGAFKTVMNFLRRNFWVPDDRMFWIKSAYKKAEEILEKYPVIESIYTSNYPNSDHVVGMKLRQKYDLNWVADFRDGWTQNPAFFDPSHSWIERKQKACEKQVVQAADDVVSVSPPITDHLQQFRKPHQSPVQTITNGFDPKDFEEARNQQGKEKFEKKEKLSIVYTGTFFGRRHPRDFFRIVGQLLKKNPEWKKKLELNLFCSLTEQDRRFAKKCGLNSETLRVHEPVGFKQCLLEQQKADVLLLVLEKGPGSEIMVSQKVFEYLASRKPIYALVPDGAAAEILTETGGALIETSRSLKESVVRFRDFLESVRSGNFVLPSGEKLQKFHRRDQAVKIANLLVRSGNFE